jgi:FtsZ-interacting cell division protein ZipA
MSTLQLGLIIAGVVLVAAVLVYNWWQERRVQRRIDSAFRKSDDDVLLRPKGSARRVEPTLRDADGDQVAATPGDGTLSGTPAFRPGAAAADVGGAPPMEVIEHARDAAADDESLVATPEAVPRMASDDPAASRQPDPDIECVVILQPAHRIGVGALAAGLHARLGKRLRWFGRAATQAPWQPLASDTRGEFVELAACMLLADRNGAASRPQLETFVRVLGELAPLLPAAISAPDVAAEAERAEALDRLCADVDVQIGLTVLKADGTSIPGTKLRGMAEAAGFRLAPGGRFEWLQEDTGHVHYTLQNVRNEPFTVDTLRISATNGVVFVLDVPRVADPARVFDQMKLAAKRLAHTLAAELVDDNRRPLDDAALAAIRKQVDAAAAALSECGIEPGSPRALALFGA